MRTALALALPVVACLIACGGGGPPEQSGPRQITDREAIDRVERMVQPKMPGNTPVTLESKEASMNGKFAAYLGNNYGEDKVLLPNGTKANVIVDGGPDGLFAVQVMFTTGEYVNRGAWVNRGDVHR